ncbi:MULTISPECIES: plasmid stabilization protein [unclassified Crossiella]|uniref:FitA-like ribbon-helix-helix domain-containing protein n=1 Tax=unclassified Crossiella TaxID=2620835 RepID=UPI00200018F1|nr:MULTISPECIES: plasmid stabilization protein [unclassified Crossiella]MCK2242470.1 plasmid stabilization protein [Crossiella sp. S99.2]MCK2254500.1 plasmid stabilization protein [Crossiella sp. S99.1]
MAVLTIRDFDESLKAKLRVRAAEHGRSMEAEVRAILASVLTRSESGPGMGSRIRQRFADVDEVAFEPPRRVERARAAEFPE